MGYLKKWLILGLRQGKYKSLENFVLLKSKVMLKKDGERARKKVYILGDSISKKVKINC